MNKERLYELLPDPDSIGAAEYRIIHNLLVDAINEWSTDNNDEVSGFALTVLSEVSDWTSNLIDVIAKETHGDSAS